MSVPESKPVPRRRGGGAYRLAASFLLAALAVAMGIWLLGWSLRHGVGSSPAQYPADAAEAATRARDVRFDPDPSRHSTPYRNLRVVPQGEPPALAELVAERRIPPVDERLPAEPVVMEGPEGLGQYGGTWLRLAGSDAEADNIITWRLSGPYLVRWSPLGYPIQPHIAKSVEPSEDRRVWTIHLRPGLRWSDGKPYTADDLLYWWEREASDPMVLGVVPNWMRIGGKPARVERVGPWEVRISFDEPNALFLEQLSSHAEFTNYPAHYLSKYHPRIGDRDLIAREMAAYGMPSPSALYTFVKQPRNPQYPRLWPWVYRTYRPTPPQVFVRNPYYFAVDPAGNQLPYIDRVQIQVQDPSIMAIAVANGGSSMQDRSVSFNDYTELMTRRHLAGTRVLHWYQATRSNWVISPNLTRRIDPSDPSTRWKAQLLADKRFRQALSLAIDRNAIIRADSSGIGEPSQVSPGAQSPFANEDLAKAYTEFDPPRANRLLNEIGLSTRDREGYRTFPDGTRMTFLLDISPFTGIGPAQFVVDDWSAVGVRVMYRMRSRSLFVAEKDAMNFDLNVWTSESDYMPLVSPRFFVATMLDSFYAVGWGRWFMRGGMYGDPKADAPGSFPPPPGHPMREAMRLYEAALRAPSLAEQKRQFRGVAEIAAENVWSISISTAPPALAVVDQNLRNVPDRALQGTLFSTPSNTGMETWYFAGDDRGRATLPELKAALTQHSTLPGGAAPSTRHATDLWKTARITIILSLAATLAFWAIRYPFVGRRLLMMVPTLLIISIAVFTVIRLPPGDFLTQRIMQLQSTGDEADLRQIEDLRQMFHTEEPAWRQYSRWAGFTWFLTFDKADRGLLQGDLGRSMETLQPVGVMAGDRILLTVILSLATILFTWALAIPVGIYSAVRQYTVGDYLLTLIGFVGMSVPAFLLALVLMAAAGVSGLFSPVFAVQATWSWPKVLDLLKHLWIPVVVLGVGGTAGLIRVMRANLLDELRKPYVVTARAKGVRPIRLLLKYPVRVALNPFVSGVGALFPQLVSGGAIVSIVLSLPMIGPMLLAGLLSQDMYLAGSMLMVLSTLAVIGTLVSDVLLLWLDPRIRFEGGSR